MIETSIVIPVYNNWDLTRNCLKSIAAHTPAEKLPQVEIIVVDNASTDATPGGCQFLGRQLFGENFRYIRNEVNRNFGGASNQGAKAARGEFLVFLNNDTEVLPGWYEPLLEDFREFPDLAATGPLLLYPGETPLGRTVQHLGVYVSPGIAFGHLYAGIPAASPLAQKRRFFQVITAACMAIRKSMFLEVGAFDERFVNGFEDVDLCARLKGRRLTVNPRSQVIHHESQTPGRHNNEESNTALLYEKIVGVFLPDRDSLVRQDGIELQFDPWLIVQYKHPGEILARLESRLAQADATLLRELLVDFPYWEGGWEGLLRLAEGEEKRQLLKACIQLFRTPARYYEAYALGKKAGDRPLVDAATGWMRLLMNTPAGYLAKAQALAETHDRSGFHGWAEKARSWMANYGYFREKIYPLLARAALPMAREAGLPLHPGHPCAYALWLSAQEPVAPPAYGPGFSILMPVYNPDADYFRAALDSILAQTYGNWELCLADDASTTPETREIIREYMARDRRIKAVFREENGHIAQATNSALELARKPWCALMDQDDLLAPDALAAMARAIMANPEGLLFYSDEDKALDGEFVDPHFKNSRWDRELLLGENFVCHLGVYATAALRKVRGIRGGVAGAQDHDLVFRYTAQLRDNQIVHVPRVLYHWRAHEGSTARKAESKAYAVESAIRATQEHLNRHCPGAVATQAPERAWVRVLYPLPEKLPRISILYAGDAPPEFPFACEIIPVVEPADMDAAARQAQGEILGILGPGVVPADEEAAEVIISNVARQGIGAVGGLISQANGSLVHGGYLTDVGGLPTPLFRGAPAGRLGWWMLSRTVDALDGLCLFTRKDTFLAAGGLDGRMGAWAWQDYCLRLGQQGLRCVWTPFARFTARQGARVPLAPQQFRDKWRHALPPFNPSLKIDKDGFSLVVSA